MIMKIVKNEKKPPIISVLDLTVVCDHLISLWTS